MGGAAPLTAALLFLSLHLNWLLSLPSSPQEAFHEMRERRPLVWHLPYDEAADPAENLRRALDHAREHPGRYRS